MVYYYLPQPPFFLVIAGLLIAVTSGLAFEGCLKLQARIKTADPLNNGALQFSFWGTCVGMVVFLAGGLEVVTFDRVLSYGIAVPLVLFIAYLVWSQLQGVMMEWQRGGARALDLDILDYIDPEEEETEA